MTTELKLFDITDTAIAELKELYTVLKINGLDDKEGYKRVKTARLDMKSYRIAVDKRRKELTEDAIKHQRLINNEAKRITEKLSEIEDYLEAQETFYLLGLDEIKNKEQKRLDDLKQRRIDKLLTIGFRYNGKIFTHTIKTDITFTDDKLLEWDDDTFNVFYVDFKLLFDEESKKLEELQRQAQLTLDALKAEQERIDAENKKERERIYAEQIAQKAKLDAEQARIAHELKLEQDRVKDELESKRRELQEKSNEITRKEKELQERESALINENNIIEEIDCGEVETTFRDVSADRMWIFKKGVKFHSDDFWYDITDGGYIKPNLILENEYQSNTLLTAIGIVYSFQQAYLDRMEDQDESEVA